MGDTQARLIVCRLLYRWMHYEHGSASILSQVEVVVVTWHEKGLFAKRGTYSVNPIDDSGMTASYFPMDVSLNPYNRIDHAKA